MGANDPTIIPELIDTFCADTPRLLEEIRTSLPDRNAEIIQRAAHTLKSNSAILGAEALASLSSDLEILARDQQLADAPQRLAQIEAAYAQVRQAFQAVQLEAPPAAV